MNNYFNGFGAQCVTVPCEDTVKHGEPVGLDSNSVAYTSFEGTDFIGICEQVRDGYATVALKGYTELDYEGEQPIVGFVTLICAADGKVKTDPQFGRSVLVVSVDAENKRIGVIL